MPLRKINKILYLGYEDSPIVSWLKNENIIVETTLDKLDPIRLRDTADEYDWVVSYRYPHIVTPEVISLLTGRLLNLHISYLPWNKGADPNLWSFVDDTPKGISIHQMDEGIDTGGVYCQKQLHFHQDETLALTYKRLNNEISELFFNSIRDIVSNNLLATPQKGKGSYHRKKDKQKLPAELFKKGWDISIKEVKNIMNSHTIIKE
jgi:methionyl-tRNA formyltransferase